MVTNLYDQAKFWAKNWAKFWTKIPGHLRASLAVQNDPPKFLPNSSQFITPCLVTAPVTEISKFHLRELLGLGVPRRVVEKLCVQKKFVLIFWPFQWATPLTVTGLEGERSGEHSGRRCNYTCATMLSRLPFFESPYRPPPQPTPPPQQQKKSPKALKASRIP